MSQLGFLGVAPPAQTVEKWAVFSSCRTWRYELGRVWDRSKPIDLWVLINPSTADEKADDPTVQSMMRRARHLGRGGFCLVNLFAFCSSTPETLLRASDPIGPENAKVIQCRAEELARAGGKLIVAWGSSLDFKDPNSRPVIRARDAAMLTLLSAIDEVLCIGRSGPGNASPTHPLARGKHRVPEDAPLQVFVPGADRPAPPKRERKDVRPFSEVPPSDADRPPLGSASCGECVWCAATAEGRYGAPVDGRTLPLCNACGPSERPTLAEIRAKVRAVSMGRCRACDTPGPRGECAACGGSVA